MGIDPVEAVKPYIDRIPHAQAKDIELDPRPAIASAGRARLSTEATPGTWAGGATGCPGSARSTGPASIDALYEGGFEGVLSVEHEDPVWGGTEEKVEIGLKIAHRTLRPLIVA